MTVENVKVKPRERTAILQSLGAGVVPRIGLHLIQVGRQREVEALVDDLKRIEEGGATIRYVIGRFGTGKSFFLNLLRTVALERKHVVMQADITLDRRFHSTSGHARHLYNELVSNMATRARPDGGAMPGLVERFVTDVAGTVGSEEFQAIEDAVGLRLEELRDMTMGVHFIRVLSRYIEGFSSGNDDLKNAALRWLRGEYSTKTEARQDLGVRDIIEDANLYDMLRIWGVLGRVAGYKGLFVNLDEMVVLSERLNVASARDKNYEVLLQILNDCLQGHVGGIGFCFAGTDEFLTDTRRGLYSYEALKTRLAENPFARDGLIDMAGPVIRLQSLTQEELFVLLEKIALVQAGGNVSKMLIDEGGIQQFMEHSLKRLGASAFRTPRDSVKEFLGLLQVMEQNPGVTLDGLLGRVSSEPGQAAQDDGQRDELERFQL
jgi:hypothetical protein